MTPAELVAATEAIHEKYPHWWRDDQAQAEMLAIWGDTINRAGVMTDTTEEKLYDKDGYRATITIGRAAGVYAFGCNFMAPTEGFGWAPSISGKLFTSENAARTGAIACLLKRLPERRDQHEQGQRVQLERMRDAIGNELRQPSLF